MEIDEDLTAHFELFISTLSCDIIQHITMQLSESLLAYQADANAQTQIEAVVQNLEFPTAFMKIVSPPNANIVISFLNVVGQINANIVLHFRDCLGFLLIAFLTLQDLDSFDVLYMLASNPTQELLDALPSIAEICHTKQFDITKLVLAMYSGDTLPDPARVLPAIQPTENGVALLNLAKIMTIIASNDETITHPYLDFLFSHCTAHPDPLSGAIIQLATIVKANLSPPLVAEFFDSENENDCFIAMRYIESTFPESLAVVNEVGIDLFWAILEDGILEGGFEMRCNSLKLITALFKAGDATFNGLVLSRHLFGNLQDILESEDETLIPLILELLSLVVDYSSVTGNATILVELRALDFPQIFAEYDEELSDATTVFLQKLQSA